MKRLGAYLPDTALLTRALVFQPCLERPLIRFGLLEGAARGRGANLPQRFYRPLGEAVSPPSSAKFFTSRVPPFRAALKGKVLLEARYKGEFVPRSGTNEPQWASNICGLGSSAAADSPYRLSLITPIPNHLISHESRLVAATPR